MIRFEPWTSGVGINTCANWATTNAQAAPDYDILGSNPSKTLFIESQTKIDWFSILTKWQNLQAEFICLRAGAIQARINHFVQEETKIVQWHLGLGLIYTSDQSILLLQDCTYLR